MSTESEANLSPAGLKTEALEAYLSLLSQDVAGMDAASVAAVVEGLAASILSRLRPNSSFIVKVEA